MRTKGSIFKKYYKIQAAILLTIYQKNGKAIARPKTNTYLRNPKSSLCNARMAELVDALVSNTSELTLVPVRSRLRVLKIPHSKLTIRDFLFG